MEPRCKDKQEAVRLVSQQGKIINPHLNLGTSTTFLLGIVVLLPVLPSWAASEGDAWQEGHAQLEKKLAPGQATDRYRAELEAGGDHVTAVNYHNPEDLEY